MNMIGHWLLIAALNFSGISTTPGGQPCDEVPGLAGAFIPEQKTILVCEDSLPDSEELMVLAHESVHVIHWNLGWSEDQTIIPEPLFTQFVRETVPSEETLFVLQGYPDNYRYQELEARGMSSVLPSPVIAFGVFISKIASLLFGVAG